MGPPNRSGFKLVNQRRRRSRDSNSYEDAPRCFVYLSPRGNRGGIKRDPGRDTVGRIASVATRRQRRHRALARRPDWHARRSLNLELRARHSPRRHGRRLAQLRRSRYFNYIQKSVDALVAPDGSIPTLKPEEHQLDNILLGRQLLLLYRVTQNKRYLTAATFLYEPARSTAAQRRPAVSGTSSAIPTRCGSTASTWPSRSAPSTLPSPITPKTSPTSPINSSLMEQHARDPKTGLLYHGWDESKQERWANKQTGDSSAILGARHGLVHDGPRRHARLLSRRRSRPRPAHRHSPAAKPPPSRATRIQSTGLWYDVMNKPGEKGNYFESSAACMFVYALAKGVRRAICLRPISPTPSAATKASSPTLSKSTATTSRSPAP